MLDIKWIRDCPDAFEEALKNRNCEDASQKVAKILACDSECREQMTELQNLQTRKNQIADAIGMSKRKGESNLDLEKEAVEVKQAIQDLETKKNESAERLKNLLSTVPNIPLDDVPVGPDESANVCVRTVGEVTKFDFTPKHHYELGEQLGIIDFASAAKISGSRFTVLKKAGALLERAIKNFMLDTHTREYGYTEMGVPFLVKSESMFGTGQLPKFSEDSFQTTDGRWLISTAEVPLTNLVRDEIIPAAVLPIRITAYSACFRSEAGAAGRDTRGMIRNHQFSKVELVSIVHPDQGEEELERMTSAAENILKKLKLPYRVMLLSSGDMGFSARKTYDLEVWLPSEDTYREISSCSLCGQFQARRMNARYKGGDDKGYVATLNGSGLAIGRTMVAILENYQRADGSVKIPDVLVPYMNGITELR